MNQFEKIIFGIVIFMTSAAYILSKIPSLNPPGMHKKEITMKGFLRLLLIALIILIFLVGVFSVVFNL